MRRRGRMGRREEGRGADGQGEGGRCVCVAVQARGPWPGSVLLLRSRWAPSVCALGLIAHEAQSGGQAASMSLCCHGPKPKFSFWRQPVAKRAWACRTLGLPTKSSRSVGDIQGTLRLPTSEGASTLTQIGTQGRRQAVARGQGHRHCLLLRRSRHWPRQQWP